LKNTAKKPSIGTDMRCKQKKGNPTPRAKTKRPTPKFYDVKIRLSVEDYARGLPYFANQKHFSKFILDAYWEKVKRAEAHDKEAKQKRLTSDMNALEPVLKEMYAQGKLSFLNGEGKGDGK
jgi:hypothetical protein